MNQHSRKRPPFEVVLFRRYLPISVLYFLIALPLVTLAVLCSGWMGSQGIMHVYPNATSTSFAMSIIEYALDRHYEENENSFPVTLEQLSEYDDLRKTINERYEESYPGLCDAWGYPLIYHKVEDHYVLKTYGRDGNPGGVGLDQDFDYIRNKTGSTFYQFAWTRNQYDVVNRGVWVWGIVCSVLSTLLLVIFHAWVDDLGERKVPLHNLVKCATALLIMTVIMGFILAVLYLPLGH